MSERRSFFRIDESIALEYKEVDEKTANTSEPESLYHDAADIKLYAELKKIDSDTAQLLYQIKDSNRALGEYLHNLNRKIELLAQRLMAEHKPAALTRITRQVNLSEGGIAFGCEKPIDQNRFIAMRLTFLPSYVGLILFAKVIRCELSSAGDYQIAAKFHRITDLQQQLIGQQIMRAQMADKRRLKQQY
ncbi:MAG: PilZ domain-containing protein [Cellvibrio sp.]|jgi:PilZ domain.